VQVLVLPLLDPPLSNPPSVDEPDPELELPEASRPELVPPDDDGADSELDAAVGVGEVSVPSVVPTAQATSHGIDPTQAIRGDSMRPPRTRPARLRTTFFDASERGTRISGANLRSSGNAVHHRGSEVPMKRFVGFVALFGTLLLACAGSDGTQDPSPSEPADEQSEDLSSKRCGAFLHGTCPSGSYCDMSSVPAGSVGGSGVCRKGHHCILNGMFICPKGQSFDPAVCHCH
jgi:hypothetical protein